MLTTLWKTAEGEDKLEHRVAVLARPNAGTDMAVIRNACDTEWSLSSQVMPQARLCCGARCRYIKQNVNEKYNGYCVLYGQRIEGA